MSYYALLLALHLVSVIVWLGTTTSLALLAGYGVRRRDAQLLARMPELQRWFGPRAVGPASLATLGSGVSLALYSHADFEALWLRLALSAFFAAAVLSLAVRLPASLRRKRALAAGNDNEVSRADRWLLWGSWVELSILYLAVLDMTLKPTAANAGWLAAGVLWLCLVAVGGWLGLSLAPRLRRSAS